MSASGVAAAGFGAVSHLAKVPETSCQESRKGLGRVVPNVEQENAGAFEVHLFFGKTVVFGDFAVWRILGRFRSLANLFLELKRRRSAIFDRR